MRRRDQPLDPPRRRRSRSSCSRATPTSCRRARASEWHTDPFVPTIRDGKLFARGAADMKTSIAAFVVAAERIVAAHPSHPGSLALLITSDEEGPALDGTVRVVEALRARGETIDYCIVGEPTSAERFGDTIKNGRRGSLSGRLVVQGVQGHVAYPHLARNPVHELAPGAGGAGRHRLGRGQRVLPADDLPGLQHPRRHGRAQHHPGRGAASTSTSASRPRAPSRALKARVHAVLDRHGLDYELAWIAGRQALPHAARPARGGAHARGRGKCRA